MDDGRAGSNRDAPKPAEAVGCDHQRRVGLQVQRSPGDLRLIVAYDFVEWHVIVIKPPAIVIQGVRQFNEAKALEHARQLADS